MSFKGQTVMLTGAAGNLGQAVVAAFAARGERLVLLARQVDDLRAVFGEEGPERLYVSTDLLEAQQVAAALTGVLTRFGRVDVLCNLASGFRMGPAVHETPGSTWDFLLDINARTLLTSPQARAIHGAAVPVTGLS